jgi:hypothetical protein
VQCHIRLGLEGGVGPKHLGEVVGCEQAGVSPGSGEFAFSGAPLVQVHAHLPKPGTHFFDRQSRSGTKPRCLLMYPSPSLLPCSEMGTAEHFWEHFQISPFIRAQPPHAAGVAHRNLWPTNALGHRTLRSPKGHRPARTGTTWFRESREGLPRHPNEGLRAGWREVLQTRGRALKPDPRMARLRL